MPTFLAWHMWHMVRVHTAIMTRHTIIPTDTIIVASAIWHRHGLSLLSRPLSLLAAESGLSSVSHYAALDNSGMGGVEYSGEL